MMQIDPIILSIIAGVCHVDESSIESDAEFAADLGADPIHMLEISMLIEDAYHFAASEAFEHIETVGELAAHVSQAAMRLMPVRQW
jgi:acyl carrier protein